MSHSAAEAPTTGRATRTATRTEPVDVKTTATTQRAPHDQGAQGSDVVVLDHTGYVGHGNTVASWACIAIMSVGVLLGLIGFTIMGLGSVLMWVGIGVIVLGGIVGAVLKAMGMGYEGEVRKHERGELKH